MFLFKKIVLYKDRVVKSIVDKNNGLEITFLLFRLRTKRLTYVTLLVLVLDDVERRAVAPPSHISEAVIEQFSVTLIHVLKVARFGR